MKKEGKQKAKEKKIPQVWLEWLYLSAGEPVLERLYTCLLQEDEEDVQFWKEAGVLEIGLPDGGPLDLEFLEEEYRDEALRSYMEKQQADQVCTVTFQETDQKKARRLMEKLVQRAGGVFCQDTEEFLPEIRRK